MSTEKEIVLEGENESGRKFKIFPKRNYLEWQATNTIGPIGIPIKEGTYSDLFNALVNGFEFRQYLNIGAG